MRCQGKTDDGKPCKRVAVYGDYCEKHKEDEPYSPEIIEQHEIGKKEEDPAAVFLEWLKANVPEQAVGAFEALLQQNKEMKIKLEMAAKDHLSAIEQGRQAQAKATPEEIAAARKQAAEGIKKARAGIDTTKERARQNQEPKVKVTRFEKEFTVLKDGERRWASMVQVNGVNYVFISGEAQEVPASVASMLENRDVDRANLVEKMERVQGIQEYEKLRAALEN